MSRIPTTEEFLGAVSGGNTTAPVTKYGTIPADYTSGRPRVQFDGETTASTKTYPYLSWFTPQPGQRVLLLKVGKEWLILGPYV